MGSLDRPRGGCARLRSSRVSDATDQAGRAVSGRRWDRCDCTDCGAGARRCAWPAGRGAEPRWSRWRNRNGFRCEIEPDGYTLLYHSTTGIVHAAVTDKLPYEWMRDLAPVSIITRFAPVMIVSPTLPVKDLREFIALLEGQSRQIQFRIVGHRYSGPSGGGIIQAESRRRHASHTLSRDFRAMPDLLTGRVAMMIDGVPVRRRTSAMGRCVRLR